MPSAVHNTDPVNARPVVNARPTNARPVDEDSVDHEAEEWSQKLKGKKLGEMTDETTFATADLPQDNRIIKHGYGILLDYISTRINICLAKDETVEESSLIFEIAFINIEILTLHCAIQAPPNLKLDIPTKPPAKMPLVAPQISGDVVPQTQDWTNRLMGKTIGDENNATTFAMSDLPENTRIIPEGQPEKADFQENRLNVYLAKDGTVRSVHQG
ncbi:hypothetical protein V491_08940 [Pseudogymnoascus sp. VKM F-3775]|nr:hypothetical protein V491_08940 [Pseudogymnoascus sp. VKM F-3775]